MKHRYVTRLDEFVILVVTLSDENSEKILRMRDIAIDEEIAVLRIPAPASVYLDDDARHIITTLWPDMAVPQHDWIRLPEADIPGLSAQFCQQLDLEVWRQSRIVREDTKPLRTEYHASSCVLVGFEEDGERLEFISAPLTDEMWKCLERIERARFIEAERKKFFEQTAFKLPFGAAASVTYRCEETGKTFKTAAEIFDHVEKLKAAQRAGMTEKATQEE